MAATNQTEQRAALKKQLEAELEAQLATYETQAKANAAKQKTALQKAIEDVNNQYTAYESQTNADMAKNIEQMLTQYGNDANRRGLARSTYALERNKDGEAAMRQEVTRALAAAAANRDANVNSYRTQLTDIDTQLTDALAAQRLAGQQNIAGSLAALDLSYLQQQQELENQKELLKYQQELKGSSGGGGGARSSANPYADALNAPTVTGKTQEQMRRELDMVQSVMAQRKKAEQAAAQQQASAAKKTQTETQRKINKINQLYG